MNHSRAEYFVSVPQTGESVLASPRSRLPWNIEIQLSSAASTHAPAGLANSAGNSTGRLERVSKRLTTAGSLCSTEGGSWERRERIRPVCGTETKYSALD